MPIGCCAMASMARPVGGGGRSKRLAVLRRGRALALGVQEVTVWARAGVAELAGGSHAGRAEAWERSGERAAGARRARRGSHLARLPSTAPAALLLRRTRAHSGGQSSSPKLPAVSRSSRAGHTARHAPAFGTRGRTCKGRTWRRRLSEAGTVRSRNANSRFHLSFARFRTRYVVVVAAAGARTPRRCMETAGPAAALGADAGSIAHPQGRTVFTRRYV